MALSHLHGGDTLFPCWEHFIPMLGTFYSHVGNVFVKPDEQSETCFGFAMARKGGMKSKEFYVFAQDLTVSRKEMPVYRCFTRF